VAYRNVHRKIEFLKEIRERARSYRKEDKPRMRLGQTVATNA
jgi:hypothetical protein